VSWWSDIRDFRRNVLGINRRNQDFVFKYNTREMFRLADHKVETKRVLQRFGIPVPRTYSVFEVQWDIRRLGWAVRRLDDFILKPAGGAGGGGVLAIVRHDGEQFFKASGKTLRLPDLEDHVSDILAGAFSLNQQQDVALLEYRVHTHALLDAMSYGGVPDVRMLVFLGVPVLAMLRLPTRQSDGRANLHMGGVERHPDLDFDLIGVEIPFWPEILEISARTYDAIGLGYLGVDLVIDQEKGPMVLEANARPGLAIQLANGKGLRPLLDRVLERQPQELPVNARIDLGTEIFRATS
jgi:glutathione synthase/RimK-type ligase-like ATP-grasp enzyme